MKILHGVLSVLLLTSFASALPAQAKTTTPATKPVAVTTTSKTSATAKKATKQEMIVQVLPLFIKVYGKNPSESDKAWWRKRISCGELTSISAITDSMQFHKSKGVTKGSANICGQTAAITSSSATSGVTKRSVAGVADNPTVRIGIFNTDGSAIDITANSQFQIREGVDKVLGTVGKDDVVSVSWSSGKYHVRGSGLKFDTAGKIRFTPLNGGIMQIKSYHDKSVTYKGKDYNRFRGVIEIRKATGSKTLWAINELRTELYLRGLGETSGNGPDEYVKALVIAARTYVIYHKVVTGGRSDSGDFDITNTADDQLYRGYEYELIAPRIGEMAGKVKGVIVADSEGDHPVAALYFSDSDGHTRTAKEVWGTNRFPQLQKSVKDPYHVSSTCLGHCVGMSAQGAYGFASKEGWNFQKILNYFFYNIRLVKAY